MPSDKKCLVQTQCFRGTRIRRNSSLFLEHLAHRQERLLYESHTLHLQFVYGRTILTKASANRLLVIGELRVQNSCVLIKCDLALTLREQLWLDHRGIFNSCCAQCKLNFRQRFVGADMGLWTEGLQQTHIAQHIFQIERAQRRYTIRKVPNLTVLRKINTLTLFLDSSRNQPIAIWASCF